MSRILDAIFPPNIYCICCGAMIDSTRPYSLCDRCRESLHWAVGRTCQKCGKVLQDTYKGDICYDCMVIEHSFDKGFTCLDYGLHEREIMMDFKYNSKGYLGSKLGEMLYDRISWELSDAGITIDGIIPVPVHRSKEKTRGYNQAALMARQLGKLMGVPCMENVLVRTRATVPLRSLNPAERQATLKGVFALRSEGEEVTLQGKNLLLIDDIFTTGATADACSKVLKDGGAEHVYLLTLAAGGNKNPRDSVIDG